ncbi:hypothetical protein DFH11DRAFT_1727984 [Phellopilus nigrolimitatus]|nr:hypothetical protein DFH11DRAFT_1727984 [Phellopilus nigrolimitatus]
MASDNTSPFQYKICGYRLDRSWFHAWGEARGLLSQEDLDNPIGSAGINALMDTSTALKKAVFACGVQAHKGGILPIGPEDAEDRDMCVYVATNMYPAYATLPDEDTMIKVKTLLERKMDEEPQWYESTTAIKFGNRRWCSKGGTEESVGSATNPGQYKICGYRLDYSWLEAWGEARGFLTQKDLESPTGAGADGLLRTSAALKKAIFACGVQAHKGGILPIGSEDAEDRDMCVYVATNMYPAYATLPDEDTMTKVKELLEREMDEEPQWYESTTAIRYGK